MKRRTQVSWPKSAPMCMLCSFLFCRPGCARLKLMLYCLELGAGPYEGIIYSVIAWDSRLYLGLEREVRELTDMIT